MRSVCALLLLCLAACSGSGASTPPAGATKGPAVAQASIWFHPLPPGSNYPDGPAGGIGSSDYFSLFSTGASWPRAAAKVSVFGMYAGWIMSASDAQLQSTIAFLNAHNMGIELESPALQALANCGAGVEGYVPYGSSIDTLTLAYLQRLKAFGGRLLFVKTDEPFFFGTVSNEPQVCHFSVSNIAQQEAHFASLVAGVYPQAQVGDVEPIIDQAYSPDVVTAIGQWMDAYQAAAGAPFPFFITDNDFSNSAWPALAKSVEAATRQRGIRSGIIYIGDRYDTTDAQWTGKVVARFEAYQGTGGGNPDYVLFQSWEPHPLHCLPETDSTTFTGALDAYISFASGGS